jgi:IclR family acetate operon transcriptional repressor
MEMRMVAKRSVREKSFKPSARSGVDKLLKMGALPPKVSLSKPGGTPMAVAGSGVNDRLGGSRSVARTCAILRLISQRGDEGVSLVDVAGATRLPKSSAHRYLQVLEDEGFVERDMRSSRYRLGLGFISLQAGHVERLIQRTRPHLARIRDQFDETVNLGMLVGHQIVYLEILESPKAMRLAARKGDTEGVHSTALGKAITATLADREVLELLRRAGMPKHTPRTITTPEEFLRELQRVRDAGYAIDDRENEEEGRCVAVYVPGLSTPTAISLSGVASRFSIEATHEVASSLRIAAIEISGADLPPVRPLQLRNAA